MPIKVNCTYLNNTVMRIVKDYPPNQLIPAQVECFNYILKHLKKHHGICNGREFYYWDKGWVIYTLEYIKEDVMDLLGNRYRKTALSYVLDQLAHKLTKTSSIPDHHIPFLEGYYCTSFFEFISCSIGPFILINNWYKCPPATYKFLIPTTLSLNNYLIMSNLNLYPNLDG